MSLAPPFAAWGAQSSLKYPRSKDGKRALTCSLNLGSKKSRTDGLIWKRRTNTWPELSTDISSRTLERIKILSSTTYSDEQGDIAIEIKTDPDEGSHEDDNLIHWLHIQRDNMDLDEFERLALQTPRISGEMAFVVSHLMTKVRSELEKSFIHGRYMRPGALRCDGLNLGERDKEDICATWVCMPYLSMEKPDASRTGMPSKSSYHPLRTIFQSCYDFLSTMDWDSNKKGSQIAGEEWKDKVLHLPQLWCLIIGTETIISSSHAGLDTLFEPAISRTIMTGDHDKVALVKIIDPYKRHFFFPIGNCRTFFELRELVIKQCLSNIFLDVVDYKFVYNKRVLGSHNWMDVIRCARSLIIEISIVKEEKQEELKPGKLKPRNELVAHFHSDTLDINQAIGGADLGKNGGYDSSTDEDIDIRGLAQAKVAEFHSKLSHNTMSNQLIRYPQPHSQNQPSLSRRGSKERKLNLEKVQGLTRKGLIVNDPDSLAAKKKVKIYSLEPEAKVPVKPHVKGILDKNAEQVLDHSPLHISVTDTEQGDTQIRTDSYESNFIEIESSKEQVPTESSKLALRARPFLTWRLEGSSGNSGEEQSTSFNPSNSEGLKHILSRIETKITLPDFNLMGALRGSYREDAYFGRGKFYKDTPTISLDELEKLKTAMSDSLTELCQRLTLIEQESQKKADIPTARRVTFILALISEKEDTYALHQTILLHKKLMSIIELTEDLITCFVPRSYDHSLLKKIWGVLEAFIKNTIYRGVSSNDPNSSEFASSSSTQGGMLTWTIRQFTTEDTAVVDSSGKQRLLPSKSFFECPQCEEYTAYYSLAAATKHLVRAHYPSHNLNKDEQDSISILAQSSDQIKAETRTSELLKIFQHVGDYLGNATASAKEMLAGVAEASEETSGVESIYHLPRNLVRSFQHHVIYMTVAGHAIRLLDDQFRVSNWKIQETEYLSQISLGVLGFLPLRTEISMRDAMRDVILMIRTGETSESVNYAAVESRYIMLVLYKNLLKKNLMSETGLIRFYTERTLKLQYDIYYKPPRRRILAEIQLLQEELVAVSKIRGTQVEGVVEFTTIGHPISYRISSTSRRQQYQLEYEVHMSCFEQLMADKDEIDRLIEHLSNLEHKLRCRIEVLDEDNSNAIFIFTVVTAVFLPLSFFTSYFGMNTIDIRDTNQSQSTFWALALPVTLFVVTLAVFVADKGDWAREWLLGKIRSLFARKAMSSGRHPAKENGREDFKAAKKHTMFRKRLFQRDVNQDFV